MDLHEFDTNGNMTALEVAIGDTVMVRDISRNENDLGVRDLPFGKLRQAMHPQVDYPTTATAIGVFDHTALLSRAGAIGAYTLALPTAVIAGTRITFISTTAYAHTVTTPSDAIHDGVTGGAKDVITMAAFVGASITLEAVGTTWNVVGRSVATVA